MRLSKVLMWCLVGSVVLAVALTILASTSLVWWIDPEIPMALGAGAVVLCTIALGCAVVMERGRSIWWMRSGIVACGVCVAELAVLIPLPELLDDWLLPIVLIWPFAWALLMLAVGILMLPKRRGGWWEWLRRISIVLVALLAGHCCLAASLCEIHYELVLAAELLSRKPVAWVVLLCSGGVAMLLLVRWRRYMSGSAWIFGFLGFLGLVLDVVMLLITARSENPDWGYDYVYEDVSLRMGMIHVMLASSASLATLVTICVPGLTRRPVSVAAVRVFELCCPRCGCEQTGRTGEYSCPECGLTIKVDML